MPITPEEREQVLSELKRFAEDLNLTEQQKEQLQSCLVESREKLAECVTRNPDMSGIDITDPLIEHRAEIRQRVVNFLSPDQLIKWDADALQHRLVVLAGRQDGRSRGGTENPHSEPTEHHPIAPNLCEVASV